MSSLPDVHAGDKEPAFLPRAARRRPFSSPQLCRAARPPSGNLPCHSHAHPTEKEAQSKRHSRPASQDAESSRAPSESCAPACRRFPMAHRTCRADRFDKTHFDQPTLPRPPFRLRPIVAHAPVSCHRTGQGPPGQGSSRSLPGTGDILRHAAQHLASSTPIIASYYIYLYLLSIYICLPLPFCSLLSFPDFLFSVVFSRCKIPSLNTTVYAVQ